MFFQTFVDKKLKTCYDLMNFRWIKCKTIITKMDNDLVHLYKFGLKKIEKLSKSLIPKRLHPLLTPLKKKIYSKSYKRLTGIWFITWECNFACPYCWQREEPKIYRRKFRIDVSDWLKAWKRISDEFDEIIIGISGGEPFVVKDFIPMLSELPDNMKYDITSNLSFNCDEFLSHAKIKKNCVGVICSFHPSNPTNRRDYVEDFFSKVKKLSILPNTRVNFVAAPPNLKFYPVIKGWCKENNIPLHLDRYAPLKEGLKFTDEEKEFAESIISHDRKAVNIPKRQVVCSAGYSHFTLFPDGNAWPCLTMAQSNQNRIGNFLSDDFSFNNEWIRCKNYPLCAGCDYDNVEVKEI